MADDDQGQPWDQDPVAESGTRSSEPWANDPVAQSGSRSEPWANDPVAKGGEEEPSTLGTAARGVARGVVPGAAGYLGGMAGLELGAGLGAAAGSVVPGIGTAIGAGVGGIAGLLGGGALAAGVAREAQDTIADKIGLDSPESRERDVKAHPYVTAAAELGGAAATLSPGDLSTKLATRLASGAIMGTVDVVNQGVTKGFGDIDPAQTAISAAGGAVLAGEARPWARGVLGKAFPEKTFGPAQAEAKAAAEGEVVQPAGNGVTWGEGLAGDPTIQTAVKPGRAPSPGPDVTEGPAGGPGAGLNEGEFGYEGPKPPPFQPGEGGRSIGEFEPPAFGDEGRTNYLPSEIQETPPLTPEQIEERRQQLAATPARPLTNARGRPYAPQAKNIAPVENPTAPTDVGEAAASPAVAPSERPPAPPPQAPAGPEIQRIRDQFVRSAAERGIELTPEELDRRVNAQLQEQANQPPARAPMPEVDVNELPANLRRNPANSEPKSENFGGREPVGQNENIPQASAAENAEIGALKEEPRPQSLSAAAPEGGAAGTYVPPAAQKLQNAGTWQNLNKAADNLFSLPRWIFAPHTISKQSMAADKINRANMGETFGKQAEYQQRLSDALTKQDQYFRNMTPEQRASAVTEVENGVIDKSHPGWHAMDEMRKVSDEQNQELARQGATKSYVSTNLASLLADGQRQSFRDWAQNFKDDTKRYPTLGDAMKQGYGLREDLLNADGSPDVNKIYPQMIHAKAQAALRTKVVRDYREGWGEQGGIGRLDPLLHDSPHEGDKPIDTSITGGVPLYGAPEVKAVLERYLNPTLKDSNIKSSYDAYMSIKNATNAVNLLGGIYHMRFMLQESVINEVSRGMARMLNGDMGGLKDIAHAPVSPVTLAKTGKNFVLDALQNPDKIKDPFDKTVVNTLKEGGQLPPGRIRGGGITPELETGALQGLVTAWKPAFQDYMHDMVQTGLKIKNKAGAGDYLGAAKDTGIASIRALSEGLQTLMHPLFSKYIPLIKAGANFQNMKQFMIDNPGLSHDEYVNTARKFVNATDNAMGELNQSMLYAPAWTKAIGNGATVSLGWQIGDVKQFLGGMREFIRNPASAKFGKDYDPRVMYIPAFMAVTALSNIMYQLFKGQGLPQNPTDVIAPRTGGKTRSGTPERAIQPGYEKDVLEMSNVLGGPESTPKAFAHYMYNKLASLPKTAIDEFIFNQDFAGKQIVNPSDPLSKRVHDYMAYAAKHMLQPIIAQQALHEEKNKNTNIDKIEQFLGNRHAPQQWQEPQKYQARVQKENSKAAKDAQKFHRMTGYAQGGPVIAGSQAAQMQTNPALMQTNPALMQTNPVLHQTNPFTVQAHPAMEQTNPFTVQTNPMTEQTNPFTEQTDPASMIAGAPGGFAQGGPVKKFLTLKR